jgi:ABC-2 type transport system permease protein
MLARLKPMLIKEFIQILRDPKMRAVIIVIPVVQMLIFGYAVNTDVRHIRTAIYDLDNTPSSRDLASRFQGSGCFDIVARPTDERDARRLIDEGEVKALFRFNRGFSEDLSGNRTSHVQLILDGSDSNTASVVISYASNIAAGFNREVMVQRLEKGSGMRLEADPVSVVSRAWFNPNLDSRWFFLPGVIAQLVMLISIILSSMAIVREREIGTMEQIMVTPIGRAEFILGKTVPFALIGFADVVLVSLVAVFWFQVPFLGNPLTLIFATAIYLLSTLGVGLFISTVSRTQQQAMMTAFFFAMPAILLSGFIYPIANMPTVIQWITYLNPLRYYLVIIRGVFLKGVGFAVLWPQMLALAALGVVMIGLASSRFKKTLE